MNEDYSQIGLNNQLRSVNSLAVLGQGGNLKEYIDSAIEDIIRPGGVSYYNTSIGRGYQAVVGMNPAQGVFTDIQSAINYVAEQGGGNILISIGTYRPSSNLILRSNIKIFSESQTNAVVDFGSSTGIIAGTNLTNIILSNFSILNSLGTGGAIRFDNVDSSKIESIYFQGNTRDIWEQLSDYLVVDKCISNNSSGDFRMSGGTNRITNNSIINGTNSGITSGVAAFVSNNYIENIGSGLAGVYNGQRSAVIVGNIIRGTPHANGRGIWISGLGSCTVVGNIVGTAGDYGIMINSNGSNIISGNCVVGGSLYGIWMNTNTQKNVVTGNSAYSAGTSIGLVSSGSNVVVGNYAPNGISDSGTGNVIANNGTV